MRVSRELCRGAGLRSEPRDFSLSPLQLAVAPDPWAVAVAAMLQCRCRGSQAAPVAHRMFTAWPDAPTLARADSDAVEFVCRPCGFQRNRARQIVRFSTMYLGDGWNDLQELPGVGAYVADSVAVFCFDAKDLEGTDRVLRAYIAGSAPQLAAES